MAESTKAAAGNAASSSASTLILLQISSRLLTFVLNQLLVRLVSPGIFGLANIQLELLISTILFLSRDAFRTILIRSEPNTNPVPRKPTQARTRRGTTNAIHNISLLPIPIGFTLTVAACTAYVRYISPAGMRQLATFHASIALYALGALSELLFEPLVIRAVRLGHPTWRVKAEGVAVLVKILSTIAIILALPRWTTSAAPFFLQTYVKDERSTALLAFGVGQASYSIVTLLVLLAMFFRQYGVRETLDLYTPRPEISPSDGGKVWFDRPTLSLCTTMAQQGILKHCLTEADKFAVAKYATLEDQGGYALASNYGSLVARILFQPIEETTRIVFSSDLAALDASSPQYDTLRTNLDAETVERSGRMLGGLFRLHLLLACCMTVFGGPLSKTFLYVMAGPRWAFETSAADILAAYTWYLPIMGINGVVEGFVQSVASRRQIGTYSTVLLTASAGFVGSLAAINAAVGKSKAVESVLGKTGLVWANAMSLAIRAGWCWAFVIRYFHAAMEARKGGGGSVDVSPRAALPTPPTMAVFAVVAATLRIGVPRIMPSNAQLESNSGAAGGGGRMAAMHLLLPTLALACSCLAVVMASIAVFERTALVQAMRSLGRHPPAKETRKSQ